MDTALATEAMAILAAKATSGPIQLLKKHEHDAELTLNIGISQAGKRDCKIFLVATCVWRAFPYLAFSLRVRSMMPS